MIQSRKMFFFLAMVLFWVGAFFVLQCRTKTDDNKTTISTSTTVNPTIDTPMHSITPKTIDTIIPRSGIVAKSISTPVDTLFVGVDSEGVTYLGAEKLNTDILRRRLVDTLKTLKMQTGKYPNKIKVRTRGDVLMGMRGEVQDIIQQAKDSLKIK